MSTSGVDIVIPHYGVNDTINALALKCLKSIRIFTKKYRLILVANGGLVEDVMTEVHKHDKVVVINNEENLGFVRAVNQGLAASDADYVVVMNNDTQAVQDWIEKMESAFVYPNAGLAGPLTDSENCWQGRWEPMSVRPRKLNRSAMLAFFCVMIRREVLDAVGYLDEEFGMGLGDDDNYCDRVQRYGWELYLIQNLIIPHRHRSTFRALFSQEEIEDQQERARQLHHEKVEKADAI